MGGDVRLENLDEPRLPTSLSDGGDLRITLRQALTRVAPEQRQAIETAYFHDLTYEETAGRLALPVGTLKSRIRLGLRAMRAVLAPAAASA
jgi:RNA polymerase sigma-70 factor (ECF subfamily)